MDYLLLPVHVLVPGTVPWLTTTSNTLSSELARIPGSMESNESSLLLQEIRVPKCGRTSTSSTVPVRVGYRIEQTTPQTTYTKTLNQSKSKRDWWQQRSDSLQ